MLNRLVVLLDLEYIFKNQKKLDFKEVYDFMKNNKYTTLPDDMSKEVESVYYKILLNEKYKSIPLVEQINNVKVFLEEYKIFLKEHGLYDVVMEAKLSLMDIEFNILERFLESRNNVRTMRKGFK